MSTKVRASGPDSLEFLRDLLRRVGPRGFTAPVEILREKNVLGRLSGDLADVSDELQLEALRLSAAVARAEVGRHVLPLEMEGAVHFDGCLSGRGDRGVAIQSVDPARGHPRREGARSGRSGPT
jgi:hypothetical protein